VRHAADPPGSARGGMAPNSDEVSNHNYGAEIRASPLHPNLPAGRNSMHTSGRPDRAGMGSSSVTGVLPVGRARSAADPGAKSICRVAANLPAAWVDDRRCVVRPLGRGSGRTISLWPESFE
jgi:hypothetical protein